MKSSRKIVAQIDEEPDAGTAEEEGVGTGVGVGVALGLDPEVEPGAGLVGVAVGDGETLLDGDGVGVALDDGDTEGDGVPDGDADAVGDATPGASTPTGAPDCSGAFELLLTEPISEFTAASTGAVLDCGATVVQIHAATMTQPPCRRIRRSTGTL